MFVPFFGRLEQCREIALIDAKRFEQLGVDSLAINELDFELFDRRAVGILGLGYFLQVFFGALEIKAHGGDIIGLGI